MTDAGDPAARKRAYIAAYVARWKALDIEGFRRNRRKNRLRASFRGRFADEIRRTEERLVLLRELEAEYSVEEPCPRCKLAGRRPAMLMPKERCPIDNFKDPRARKRTERGLGEGALP